MKKRILAFITLTAVFLSTLIVPVGAAEQLGENLIDTVCGGIAVKENKLVDKIDAGEWTENNAVIKGATKGSRDIIYQPYTVSKSAPELHADALLNPLYESSEEYDRANDPDGLGVYVECNKELSFGKATAFPGVRLDNLAYRCGTGRYKIVFKIKPTCYVSKEQGVARFILPYDESGYGANESVLILSQKQPAKEQWSRFEVTIDIHCDEKGYYFASCGKTAYIIPDSLGYSDDAMYLDMSQCLNAITGEQISYVVASFGIYKQAQYETPDALRNLLEEVGDYPEIPIANKHLVNGAIMAYAGGDSGVLTFIAPGDARYKTASDVDGNGYVLVQVRDKINAHVSYDTDYTGICLNLNRIYNKYGEGNYSFSVYVRLFSGEECSGNIKIEAAKAKSFQQGTKYLDSTAVMLSSQTEQKLSIDFSIQAGDGYYTVTTSTGTMKVDPKSLNRIFIMVNHYRDIYVDGFVLTEKTRTVYNAPQKEEAKTNLKNLLREVNEYPFSESRVPFEENFQSGLLIDPTGPLTANLRLPESSDYYDPKNDIDGDGYLEITNRSRKTLGVSYETSFAGICLNLNKLAKLYDSGHYTFSAYVKLLSKKSSYGYIGVQAFASSKFSTQIVTMNCTPVQLNNEEFVEIKGSFILDAESLNYRVYNEQKTESAPLDPDVPNRVFIMVDEECDIIVDGLCLTEEKHEIEDVKVSFYNILGDEGSFKSGMGNFYSNGKMQLCTFASQDGDGRSVCVSSRTKNDDCVLYEMKNTMKKLGAGKYIFSAWVKILLPEGAEKTSYRYSIFLEEKHNNMNIRYMPSIQWKTINSDEWTQLTLIVDVTGWKIDEYDYLRIGFVQNDWSSDAKKHYDLLFDNFAFGKLGYFPENNNTVSIIFLGATAAGTLSCAAVAVVKKKKKNDT